MTKQDFQQVVNFIEEMKATSSTNDKKEILRNYDSPVLRKLFEYVYSPFKQYYVTSDNLKKRSDLSFDNYDDLFAMLDDLNDRNITGHSAIQCVNGFIAKNREFADVIYDVIDRNLKTRATTTLINSVMPGTVPTFDVALAEKFDGNEKKVDFESGDWWASRKLDGVRCITIFDENGEPKFYSRAGNEFLTLANLATDLKKLSLRSCILDGEVCVMKDGDTEDFQGIIKEIGRKDHTIENPMYYVFDFLSKEEFDNQAGETPLADRLVLLQTFFSLDQLKHSAPLAQIQIASKENFQEMVADASELGYEGVMIRKNVGYEGKRSKNLLKVKKMHDAEYVVTGTESGVNRIIINGAEVEEVMLKAVLVQHKGNEVRVGSGFSIDQRRYFHENPNEILGKTITVQFFEETTDQHGQHSLRFPVFKVLHGQTRQF